jgi:hypothetical protein
MRTPALTLIVVVLAASCTRSLRVAQPGSPVMQTHAVVPRPESIEIALGSPPFYITAQTAIEVPDDERVAAIGRALADWIGLAAAAAPPRVVVAQPGARQTGAIALTLGAPLASDEDTS